MQHLKAEPQAKRPPLEGCDVRVSFGFNAQTGEYVDMIEAGIIDPTSWNHLLRGAMPFTKAQAEMQPENPAPTLVTSVPYGLMYSLELNEADTFGGLSESLRENLDKWTDWAKCDKPHLIAIPCGW